MEDELIKQQKRICDKYGAEYCPAPLDLNLGIALRSFDGSTVPINGLRHLPENGTAGWYIWAGEYSSANDFFKPLHIQHLLEDKPYLLKYLGLAPGWRFLVDNDGYEDIWFDAELLKI
ncbi:immunity protein Imm33 domain-containing protein [Mucilaginibacter pedocola]|uniref:Imm33-like domain-containing protein n=1 Tax=Mucilaginibacter pedocola TaxID=1792845 RepID=A0A1S9PGH4_9SPHI|nr:hypothetical protein [Mucilaginibacter pedocola]OOQ60039.1 hypothetical protein BC343_27310 [Mucilaginibacter pedocola]